MSSKVFRINLLQKEKFLLPFVMKTNCLSLSNFQLFAIKMHNLAK